MNYGLVCISEILKAQDKSLAFKKITRKRFSELESSEAGSGLKVLEERVLHNLQLTEKIIRHCAKNSISHYRLSSSLFPLITDPTLKLQLQKLSNYKDIRNQCGSLQEAVTEFLGVADQNNEFDLEFIRFVRKKTKSQFSLLEKGIEEIPAHLKVNYVLLDEENIPIDEGRNLSKLQFDYKELVTEVIEEIQFEIEQTELQYWPDIKIPLYIEKSFRRWGCVYIIITLKNVRVLRRTNKSSRHRKKEQTMTFPSLLLLGQRVGQPVQTLV